MSVAASAAASSGCASRQSSRGSLSFGIGDTEVEPPGCPLALPSASAPFAAPFISPNRRGCSTGPDGRPERAELNSAAVRVVVRFRPPVGHEEQPLSRCAFRSDPCGFAAESADMQQRFHFDRVFDQETTQQEVYDDVGRPAVDDVLDGFHATILAYGQTGSGKTYCMFGPPGQQPPELHGVVPRAVRRVFDCLVTTLTTGAASSSSGSSTGASGGAAAGGVSSDEPPATASTSGTKSGATAGLPHERGQATQPSSVVECSFFEVYCEQLRDLLKPRGQNLQVRELPHRGGFNVDGLTHKSVNSATEALQHLRAGLRIRAAANTKLNQHSSRSHAIFTLRVQQVASDGAVRHGKLTLVDLAGSEQVQKSGSAGERLEEAKKINASLSTLGHVIDALADRRPHVPYRDSRLTRLLEDSLGGNCRTTLLVACSPSMAHAVETLSSLRFAARAKKVYNCARANVVTCAALADRQLLQRMAYHRRELASCHRELERRYPLFQATLPAGLQLGTLGPCVNARLGALPTSACGSRRPPSRSPSRRPKEPEALMQHVDVGCAAAQFERRIPRRCVSPVPRSWTDVGVRETPAWGATFDGVRATGCDSTGADAGTGPAARSLTKSGSSSSIGSIKTLQTASVCVSAAPETAPIDKIETSATPCDKPRVSRNGPLLGSTNTVSSMHTVGSTAAGSIGSSRGSADSAGASSASAKITPVSSWRETREEAETPGRRYSWVIEATSLTQQQQQQQWPTTARASLTREATRADQEVSPRTARHSCGETRWRSGVQSPGASVEEAELRLLQEKLIAEQNRSAALKFQLDQRTKESQEFRRKLHEVQHTRMTPSPVRASALLHSNTVSDTSPRCLCASMPAIGSSPTSVYASSPSIDPASRSLHQTFSQVNVRSATRTPSTSPLRVKLWSPQGNRAAASRTPSLRRVGQWTPRTPHSSSSTSVSARARSNPGHRIQDTSPRGTPMSRPMTARSAVGGHYCHSLPPLVPVSSAYVPAVVAVPAAAAAASAAANPLGTSAPLAMPQAFVFDPPTASALSPFATAASAVKELELRSELGRWMSTVL